MCLIEIFFVVYVVQQKNQRVNQITNSSILISFFSFWCCNLMTTDSRIECIFLGLLSLQLFAALTGWEPCFNIVCRWNSLLGQILVFSSKHAWYIKKIVLNRHLCGGKMKKKKTSVKQQHKTDNVRTDRLQMDWFCPPQFSS